MTSETLFKALGDMDERYIREAKDMSRTRRKSHYFKRPMLIAATIALSVCIIGITALAGTGKLKGFFKDIIGWNGAVIGTSYEQATDELEVKVVSVEDRIQLEVSMVKPDMAPYSFFEMFGVKTYQIEDMEGKVVLKGTDSEMAAVGGDTMVLEIPVENLTEGMYKLVISEMVGSSKADQPLVIKGYWECEFAVEK